MILSVVLAVLSLHKQNDGSEYFAGYNEGSQQRLTRIDADSDDSLIEVTPEIEAGWKNSEREIEEKFKLIELKINDLQKRGQTMDKELNEIKLKVNELNEQFKPAAPRTFTLNEDAKVNIIVSEIAPFGQPAITGSLGERIMDVLSPKKKVGLEKDSYDVWDLQHKMGNFTVETKSLKTTPMKIISFSQLEGTIKEFSLAFLDKTELVALTGRTTMENRAGRQSFLLPSNIKANTVKIIVFDTYGDNTARLSDIEIFYA